MIFLILCTKVATLVVCTMCKVYLNKQSLCNKEGIFMLTIFVQVNCEKVTSWKSTKNKLLDIHTHSRRKFCMAFGEFSINGHVIPSGFSLLIRYYCPMPYGSDVIVPAEHTRRLLHKLILWIFCHHHKHTFT